MTFVQAGCAGGAYGGRMSQVTPYLSVHDAAAAIDYYRRAFGSSETVRMTDKDGRIGHAEIAIGDARIMLADEWPEGGVYGPKHYGGTSVSLSLEVPDVDEVFRRAIEAGGTEERPVTDQFHGDRAGWLIDPFGHRWHVYTTIERVDADTMRERVGDQYTITEG